MRRFLVETNLTVGALITLGAEESRHALKSLRLVAGNKILLVNGQGWEAEGILRSTDFAGAVVEIISAKEIERKVRLELLQAVLKGPKMDWLIEKLTEIGASDIHVATTRHTVATGEKIERWQRIAQSALKQSGNPIIPSIHATQALTEIVPKLGDGLKILLQPGAISGLAEVVRQGVKDGATRVILAIGPEGGFSPEEERYLLDAGFRAASLSLQILRGETAALAAAAITAHSIDF